MKNDQKHENEGLLLNFQLKIWYVYSDNGYKIMLF